MSNSNIDLSNSAKWMDNSRHGAAGDGGTTNSSLEGLPEDDDGLAPWTDNNNNATTAMTTDVESSNASNLEFSAQLMQGQPQQQQKQKQQPMHEATTTAGAVNARVEVQNTDNNSYNDPNRLQHPATAQLLDPSDVRLLMSEQQQQQQFAFDATSWASGSQYSDSTLRGASSIATPIMSNRTTPHKTVKPHPPTNAITAPTPSSGVGRTTSATKKPHLRRTHSTTSAGGSVGSSNMEPQAPQAQQELQQQAQAQQQAHLQQTQQLQLQEPQQQQQQPVAQLQQQPGVLRRFMGRRLGGGGSGSTGSNASASGGRPAPLTPTKPARAITTSGNINYGTMMMIPDGSDHFDNTASADDAQAYTNHSPVVPIKRQQQHRRVKSRAGPAQVLQKLTLGSRSRKGSVDHVHNNNNTNSSNANNNNMNSSNGDGKFSISDPNRHSEEEEDRILNASATHTAADGTTATAGPSLSSTIIHVMHNPAAAVEQLSQQMLASVTTSRAGAGGGGGDSSQRLINPNSNTSSQQSARQNTMRPSSSSASSRIMMRLPSLRARRMTQPLQGSDHGGSRGGISAGTFSQGRRHRRTTTTNSTTTNPNSTTIVQSFELLFRRLGLLLGAYLLGCYHPHSLPWALKVEEYMAVAWATCAVILVATVLQRWWHVFYHGHPQPSSSWEKDDGDDDDDEEEVVESTYGHQIQQNDPFLDRQPVYRPRQQHQNDDEMPLLQYPEDYGDEYDVVDTVMMPSRDLEAAAGAISPYDHDVVVRRREGHPIATAPTTAMQRQAPPPPCQMTNNRMVVSTDHPGSFHAPRPPSSMMMMDAATANTTTTSGGDGGGGDGIRTMVPQHRNPGGLPMATTTTITPVESRIVAAAITVVPPPLPIAVVPRHKSESLHLNHAQDDDDDESVMMEKPFVDRHDLSSSVLPTSSSLDHPETESLALVPVNGNSNKAAASTALVLAIPPPASARIPAATAPRSLEAQRQQHHIHTQVLVHPALDPFYIIDVDKGARIFPNAAEPFHLDTDYFEGNMLVLIRTPDVDDPTAHKGSQENQPAVQYLQSKLRRFEFQFQLKLKKVPSGRVYFACELEDPIKMGVLLRAFVGSAMAFVKSTNSSFHYSMMGQTPTPDGKYERPHMAFPVEEGMNRVVATPPGQPVPPLGSAIEEDPESIKRRKKGLRVEWNLQDTYTFSLWSAYVDFLDWRCINLPGIRPFSLSSVLGNNPIYLTLYDIPDNKVSEKHNRCDMINIIQIEMSNADVSGLGKAARLWIEGHRQQVAPPIIRSEDSIGEPEEREEPEAIGQFAEDVEENIVEDIEENIVDSADEEAAAELGEGIYVRSGDTISLREILTDENGIERNDPTCFVCNGGGFAILQEQNPGTIIIEKAGKSRSRSKSARSQLIKSGDTIIFKLITKGRKGDDYETRFLSIHRGWWLKWVANPPSKNSHFTIYTNEMEFTESSTESPGRPTETQSSHLTLGGSFSLYHKRWSKYRVGASRNGSVTYGGRILGLYAPQNSSQDSGGVIVQEVSDEGDQKFDGDHIDPGERTKSEWMLPIQFQALEVMHGSNGSSGPLKPPFIEISLDHGKESVGSRLSFGKEHCRVDVPAWIDVMNRTDRTRQLVYAVRILPQGTYDEDNFLTHSNHGVSASIGPEIKVRLRTGRDLSKVMRAGLSWKNNTASPRHKRHGRESDVASTPSPQKSPRAGPPRQHGESAGSVMELSRSLSGDVGEMDDWTEGDPDGEAEFEIESESELELPNLTDDTGETPLPDEPEQSQAARPRKRRELIGKIARSVKTRTTSTGKTVVRQSVKMTKGTVRAGKAIMVPMRPKNPPLKEPRSARKKTIKQRERDLHVTNRKSSMKKMVKASALESPSFLAGELSAPEQSCRTVSSMLTKMSSLPANTQYSSTFSSLLSFQLESRTDHDKSFLQGGAIQVGVVANAGELVRGAIVLDCLVARCLWESHYREEYCGLYQNGICFYAPLTRTPCLELSFEDIQSIRLLESGIRSPLPCFPMIAIDTSWLCHYFAFSSKEARQVFYEKATEALSVCAAHQDVEKTTREKALWKARFWQGFQNSIESSRSLGRGKWADVSSGPKMKSRVVLNNRRMVFDIQPDDAGDLSEFADDLLSSALSFSLDSLKENPDALIKFLDATCQLRMISLSDLDLSSTTTFCMFANVYHCLLQHALLLSVNGPLHKRSFAHFMRTSCYEIGGDVFSLAELNCCVIRGNMSRPLVTKPPYIEVPKKSNAHRFYALGYKTPKTNFLLNTGDVSCPLQVAVLDPNHLDLQLDAQMTEFLQRNVSIDIPKRIVVIPKIFEVYRNDFTPDATGAALACLRYCLPYLDEAIAGIIHMWLREDGGNASLVTVKFQPTADQYHSVLRRMNFDFETET